MLTGSRRDSDVTRAQRSILRSLTTRQLDEAHACLLAGYSESFACSILRVDPSLIGDKLLPTLKEVLWERGYFGTVEAIRPRR